MIPGDRDLFETWRLILGTVCGIYALVVTLRSLFVWLGYFSGSDRQTQFLRSYAVVHLLRLRGSRFSGDLLMIGLYAILLVWLLYGHRQP
ncbi:MAG: hypothetical protein ACE5EC_02760 [Phycisphaerae bacterium]